RIRIFVEHLARLELADGAVVDLHLIGAVEDVADGMTAGMPVGGAAVAGIALGQADREHATGDVGHLLLEQFRHPLAAGAAGACACAVAGASTATRPVTTTKVAADAMQAIKPCETIIFIVIVGPPCFLR